MAKMWYEQTGRQEHTYKVVEDVHFSENIGRTYELKIKMCNWQNNWYRVIDSKEVNGNCISVTSTFEIKYHTGQPDTYKGHIIQDPIGRTPHKIMFICVTSKDTDLLMFKYVTCNNFLEKNIRFQYISYLSFWTAHDNVVVLDTKITERIYYSVDLFIRIE